MSRSHPITDDLQPLPPGYEFLEDILKEDIYEKDNPFKIRPSWAGRTDEEIDAALPPERLRRLEIDSFFQQLASIETSEKRARLYQTYADIQTAKGTTEFEWEDAISTCKEILGQRVSQLYREGGGKLGDKEWQSLLDTADFDIVMDMEVGLVPRTEEVKAFHWALEKYGLELRAYFKHRSIPVGHLAMRSGENAGPGPGAAARSTAITLSTVDDTATVTNAILLGRVTVDAATEIRVSGETSVGWQDRMQTTLPSPERDLMSAQIRNLQANQAILTDRVLPFTVKLLDHIQNSGSARTV